MIDFAKYLKDSIQGKNLDEEGNKRKRSSRWRKVRAEHIKKHPRCAVCESKTKLEVHHQIPFSIDPSMELNMENLVTLCENKKYGINCHLALGHHGNFRKVNPNIEIDILTWNKYLKG